MSYISYCCYDSLTLLEENFDLIISPDMTIEEFIGINEHLFFKDNDVYDKYYRLINIIEINGKYYAKGIENFCYGVMFTEKLKIQNPNFVPSRSGLYKIDKHNFLYEIVDNEMTMHSNRPYIMIKSSKNPFEEANESGIYMKYLDFEERHFSYNLNWINNIKGLRRRFFTISQLNENQQREYERLIQRIPKMVLFKEWCLNRISF